MRSVDEGRPVDFTRNEGAHEALHLTQVLELALGFLHQVGDGISSARGGALEIAGNSVRFGSPQDADRSKQSCQLLLQLSDGSLERARAIVVPRSSVRQGPQ